MDEISKLCEKITEDILCNLSIKTMQLLSEKSIKPRLIMYMEDDTTQIIGGKKEIIKKLNDILGLREKKIKRILDE